MSTTNEPIAWEKYPKMPLSTQSWESLKHIDEWIVTEKVHGANFSATVSDTSCTFAKRSGPLPDDEDFYSFRSQRKRIFQNWQSLYDSSHKKRRLF